METLVISLSHPYVGSSMDIKNIEEAANLISLGEVVAFPTETVYGLGADALRADAARKIYLAKGRPSDNPLIVHISRIEDVETIACDIPKEFYQIANAFWPGPLTVILKKKSVVPYETTGGMDTVAIRMPSHRVAKDLIDRCKGFVAAPSANSSGRPSPTKASHVYEDLQGKIPMILDGGSVGIGIESTIIDLSTAKEDYAILRPGYVTAEALCEVCGLQFRMGGVIADDSDCVPKAPGMKYRHYAPRADMVIVSGRGACDYIVNEATKRKELGENVAVICSSEHQDIFKEFNAHPLGSFQNLDEVASKLFDTLRDCDGENVDFIYSEEFSEEGIGCAVMNRLVKAAGGNIIKL